MNIKLILIAFPLLIMASKLMADELICEPIESEGEGHWPIPESAFTRENAIKELDNLKALLDAPAIYVEDLESKKHNAFVIFEGYILKKRISELEETSTKVATEARQEFCTFLKEKAYVSH